MHSRPASRQAPTGHQVAARPRTGWALPGAAGSWAWGLLLQRQRPLVAECRRCLRRHRRPWMRWQCACCQPPRQHKEARRPTMARRRRSQRCLSRCYRRRRCACRASGARLACRAAASGPRWRPERRHRRPLHEAQSAPIKPAEPCSVSVVVYNGPSATLAAWMDECGDLVPGRDSPVPGFIGNAGTEVCGCG
eukprot:336667-Chlamydomonas_euryale.AAC.2